jgi:hypothetical protein
LKAYGVELPRQLGDQQIHPALTPYLPQMPVRGAVRALLFNRAARGA